jgi:cysteine synthase/rhodanese-related sulfurtransferase
VQTDKPLTATVYDQELLEGFNREIKSRIPHKGPDSSKINNPTPLIDVTSTFLQCAKVEYGIDLSPKKPRVYVKFDSQIHGGSVKVRPAAGIIEHAIKTGKLRRGQKIFEATSGNFGLALGMLNKLGLEVIVLVSRKLQGGVLDELRNENVKSINLDVDICPAPGSMLDQNLVVAKATAASVRQQLGQLGLDLSVYDRALPDIESVLARQDVISLAKLLARIYEGFCPEQYDNDLNVQTHETITGPETDQQLGEFHENLTEFKIITTFGTGGTATGLSKYVQNRYGQKNVHIVFPLAHQDVAGIRTKDKATGLRFYQPSLYAGQYEVDFELARRFLKFFVSKGYDIGESTALALYASLQMANYNVGNKFVVLAADGVHKYLENIQKTVKLDDPLEVTPDEAKSKHDEYQTILWTHSMFAPRNDGIQLVASTLDVPPNKIKVAKAKDVQRVLSNSSLSEGLRSLLPNGNGKVLLVCMAGNTSLRIAEILTEKGVPAQSLTGGIMGLSQATGKQPEVLVQIATE